MTNLVSMSEFKSKFLFAFNLTIPVGIIAERTGDKVHVIFPERTSHDSVRWKTRSAENGI